MSVPDPIDLDALRAGAGLSGAGHDNLTAAFDDGFRLSEVYMAPAPHPVLIRAQAADTAGRILAGALVTDLTGEQIVDSFLAVAEIIHTWIVTDAES